jgi:uncharacterized membrane protein
MRNITELSFTIFYLVYTLKSKTFFEAKIMLIYDSKIIVGMRSIPYLDNIESPCGSKK